MNSNPLKNAFLIDCEERTLYDKCRECSHKALSATDAPISMPLFYDQLNNLNPSSTADQSEFLFLYISRVVEWSELFIGKSVLNV